HLVGGQRDLEARGPGQVPAVDEEVGAHEAVDPLGEAHVPEDGALEGRAGGLGVVQVPADDGPGGGERAGRVVLDRWHVAQVPPDEALEQAVVVDHVGHDVAGGPPLAGRRGAPSVVRHGRDGGGEVGGESVVAFGDVGHGATVRRAGCRRLEGTRRGRPGSLGTLAAVVRSVREDARGIVAPDLGLQRFRLDRYPPSPEVARLVDRYWVVTWDLRGRPSHTQHVFPHPVVNVTFQDGGPGLVTGVSTTVVARTLSGAGRVLGIMFRPAGFRPLLGRPMATIRDATLDWASVVGDRAADALARRVAAVPDGAAMAAAADAALAPLVPAGHQPWEDTAALVERVAADPAFLTVADLAREAGTTAP